MPEPNCQKWKESQLPFTSAPPSHLLYLRISSWSDSHEFHSKSRHSGLPRADSFRFQSYLIHLYPLFTASTTCQQQHTPGVSVLWAAKSVSLSLKRAQKRKWSLPANRYYQRNSLANVLDVNGIDSPRRCAGNIAITKSVFAPSAITIEVSDSDTSSVFAKLIQ
jgi:hypothetical protein